MTPLVSSRAHIGPRGGFVRRILSATALSRSRSRLRDLPDHMLADIGITRADAEAEAGRPFWDVPTWWRG